MPPQESVVENTTFDHVIYYVEGRWVVSDVDSQWGCTADPSFASSSLSERLLCAWTYLRLIRFVFNLEKNNVANLMPLNPNDISMAKLVKTRDEHRATARPTSLSYYVLVRRWHRAAMTRGPCAVFSDHHAFNDSPSRCCT